MRKFGLIGYPISGSGSPALFARAYSGAFQYDLIEDPSFEVCWQRFIEEYDGINVTAPFKILAAQKADFLSPECLHTGSTNILAKTPDGIMAYNSDFLAVREIIRSRSITGKVLVIGNGGAGKAAAYAAKSLGLEVAVANRTPAEGLIPLEEVPSMAPGCGMAIYTLPCLPEVLRGISCPVLLEANYKNPSFAGTPSIAVYIGGRQWLLEQARLGYPLLTGVKTVGLD